MKKFWKQADKAILGSVTALVLLVINILCWIFNFNSSVPMWIYLITILLFYLCCIIVYAICSSRKDQVVYRLPAVINIYKDSKNIVFVIEKNDLFNQDSYVTICYQSEDEILETVLALGCVQSITTEGYLQIKIEKVVKDETAQKILKNIKNTKSYRNSIRIKPGIHKELVKED